MKMLSVLLFLLASQWSFAQQVPVSLQIQHMIGDEMLAPGEIYSSIQGNFMVTRLSYYLSDIEVIHDGGQRTAFPQVYLLVHGSDSDYDLGLADLTNIEGVAFNIGVDSATNHADPALWPASHPLSFQSPSMHWGWASGYRFLAIEGLLDGNQDGDPEKIWEFHAVGDELLVHVEVMLDSPQPASQSSTIHITGDYLKLFDGVSMDNILHGSGSLITKMMSNFYKGPVFTGQNLVSSADSPEGNRDARLVLMANPVNELFQVGYDIPEWSTGRIILVDLNSRQVAILPTVKGRGTMNIDAPVAGSYFLVLEVDQQIVDRQQVIIH